MIQWFIRFPDLLCFLKDVSFFIVWVEYVSGEIIYNLSNKTVLTLNYDHLKNNFGGHC